MANNFRQGTYQVQNPDKYVGKNTPRFRSGWEMSFMHFLDTNDNILQWASESISIPYRNPLTGPLQYVVIGIKKVHKTHFPS